MEKVDGVKQKSKRKESPYGKRYGFEFKLLSTPNQLWQADIFTFRLGGRYVYLIGFFDDYSRYVVGLELSRSQTADQVLEVYRRAVGEYGVPKEMLTDGMAIYELASLLLRSEQTARTVPLHEAEAGREGK